MNVALSPREAAVLAQALERIELGAYELSRFADQDPDFAGQCGIEVNALEARTILVGGSCARLRAAVDAGRRMGGRTTVERSDLDQLGRLEGVLSVGANRISQRIASIDQAVAQSDDGMAKLGSIIGLASGAVGLIKSIF